jgi:hypothetical protein
LARKKAESTPVPPEQPVKAESERRNHYRCAKKLASA